MAIYYLGMKTFGRGRGKSGSRSTSAAAYRSGERIRDERTGRVYDHRHRADVIHKEIVLPSQSAAHGASLEWARDRARLWNAAEHAEVRRDARVARELTVALPHELAPAARTQLARQFAQEIADRYRSAVDVAIHAPRGDARNFHAHLLATTREITPDGLGRKTTLELSGTQRHELGLPRWREEIGSLRERWAELTNRALENAHIPARVSHLSASDRRRELASVPRVPLAAYHMERRGERSYIAEKIRERRRAVLEQSAAVSTGQARERDGPGRHEPPASGPESPSIPREAQTGERAFSAMERTIMHRLGTRVTSAWRSVTERIRGLPAASSELPGQAEAARARREAAPRDALAVANGQTHGQPTRETSRARASERDGYVEEASLKAADDGRVNREKRRSIEAGLADHPAEGGRGTLGRSRGYGLAMRLGRDHDHQYEHKGEHEASREREASREQEHDNGLDFGL